MFIILWHLFPPLRALRGLLLSLSQGKNAGNQYFLATVHWNYPVDGRLISSLPDKTVKMEYLETLHSNVLLREWRYLLLKVVEKSIQQPFRSEHQCYVWIGRWKNGWFHRFFVFPNAVTLLPSLPLLNISQPTLQTQPQKKCIKAGVLNSSWKMSSKNGQMLAVI